MLRQKEIFSFFGHYGRGQRSHHSTAPLRESREDNPSTRNGGSCWLGPYATSAGYQSRIVKNLATGLWNRQRADYSMRFVRFFEPPNVIRREFYVERTDSIFQVLHFGCSDYWSADSLVK